MKRAFQTPLLLAAALGATISLAVPGTALAGASAPAPAENSQLRLLSADGAADADGARLAGVELQLAAGWKTYWRQPGDAGVPPHFDFSGSENLAEAEVLYPAPKRFREGPVESAGYDRSLVFPVRVMPADPGKPVGLSVRLDYGVCREVCVPASAEARLAMPAAAPRDIAAAVPISGALREVPAPPAEGGLGVVAVRHLGEAIEIDLRLADPKAAFDLFAEGPADWYLPLPEATGQTGDVATFRLRLASRPAGAKIEGQSFLFTATNGRRATEQRWRLD
ncbi:MAG: protein-disulfide reductase DsbD family protein [Hyphomicrobiales bacterium]